MNKGVLVVLNTLLVLASDAQVPNTPHVPTKLSGYTAWCPLWRTDGTFRSTIRLTNQNQTAPIDTIVTLYMADGTPYQLPPVQIPKGGVQTVEVNSALAGASERLSAHLSSFGSATLSYQYDWDAVVYGTMAIVDVPRSLEYTYSFAPPSLGRPPGYNPSASAPPDSRQVYEGLWWRHTSGTAGFLTLLNTAMDAVEVDVSLSGLSAPAARTLTLPPHRTQWIDLKDFLSGTQAKTGGVRIAYTGQPYSVLVAAGLEDPASGYSTNLPLTCTRLIHGHPARASTPPWAS
jgi:hypothetical protein